jgi:hypothetical protein
MRISPVRALLLALGALLCWAGAAGAVDVLILAKDTPIRLTPQNSARALKTAQPGETYEIVGRRSGRGQPQYISDERGDLWVRVKISNEEQGFVRTDLAAVAREEYRSPKGNPTLLVNLRPSLDGSVSRDLWVIQENWRRTRMVGEIEGQPIWPSHGEWFLCQIDSERPIKDEAVDRKIELLERISANGRTRTVLAAGSNPVFHEARNEVFFYRDVDEQGDPVPPGLFAISTNGGPMRPVFMLSERYRFWKEDGDYFVQAPPPALNASAGRIAFYAHELHGVRVRITVTLDGQFVEMRRD